MLNAEAYGPGEPFTIPEAEAHVVPDPTRVHEATKSLKYHLRFRKLYELWEEQWRWRRYFTRLYWYYRVENWLIDMIEAQENKDWQKRFGRRPKWSTRGRRY